MIPKNGQVWEFRSDRSWKRLLVNHSRTHGYSDLLNVVVLDSSLPSEIGEIKQCHYWPQDQYCWKRIS